MLQYPMPPHLFSSVKRQPFNKNQMSSVIDMLPAPNTVTGFLLYSFVCYIFVLLADRISITNHFDIEEYRKRRVAERTQRELEAQSRKKAD
jgi:hypothetical protein